MRSLAGAGARLPAAVCRLPGPFAGRDDRPPARRFRESPPGYLSGRPAGSAELSAGRSPRRAGRAHAVRRSAGGRSPARAEKSPGLLQRLRQNFSRPSKPAMPAEPAPPKSPAEPEPVVAPPEQEIEARSEEPVPESPLPEMPGSQAIFTRIGQTLRQRRRDPQPHFG